MGWTGSWARFVSGDASRSPPRPCRLAYSFFRLVAEGDAGADAWGSHGLLVHLT